VAKSVCEKRRVTFEHNVSDTSRTAEPLHFESFAEEGEQAGVEIDFTYESQQRLGRGSQSGTHSKAVDG
jgi:hypothetical protein